MASTFRFVWDGNVLLHETFKKDNSENTELTTWVFEGFVPTAKLVNGKAYSIISDHLGTPILAIDSEGNEVWNRQLDIYGRVKREIKASSLGDDVRPFIPFLYQGQYYDFETNLAYNRFRYYSPETGAYISQDPIRLSGNNPNLYAYVANNNWWLDIFGLELISGESLSDDTKVFRITDKQGGEMFKFNDRELKAISDGKLNPVGVSLIRAENAENAMNIWNKSFDKNINLNDIKESTAAQIREAGFDVIHNPSKGKIGENHARLIHPDGKEGFDNDTNTNNLAEKFNTCN